MIFPFLKLVGAAAFILVIWSSGCTPITSEGAREDEAGNHQAAYLLFHQAAESGDPWGQVLLSDLLAEGRPGIPRNDAQALYWLRRAAEQDYSDAQYRLGVAYTSGGYGVKKDPIEAIRWYKKAAKRKNRYAQGLLGIAILNYNREVRLGKRRHHPEADPIEGLVWAEVAVANGVQDAATPIPGYMKMLSKKQKTAARQLAVEYRAKYSR